MPGVVNMPCLINRSLEAQNVLVFDAYSILAGSKNVRGLYTDELHLNEAGYEVLNGELVRFLATIEQ